MNAVRARHGFVRSAFWISASTPNTDVFLTAQLGFNVSDKRTILRYPAFDVCEVRCNLVKPMNVAIENNLNTGCGFRLNKRIYSRSSKGISVQSAYDIKHVAFDLWSSSERVSSYTVVDRTCPPGIFEETAFLTDRRTR